MRKAVVLLSGGIDSTVTAHYAKKREKFDIYPVTYVYAQRHKTEIETAKRQAETLGVKKHLIFSLQDFKRIGGSALIDEGTDIPIERDVRDITAVGIPITYVPARNIVFLSIALAYAESLEAFDIFIGVNAIDYSGYPDCRPEFIARFEAMANIGTKAGVENKGRFCIHTPLIDLRKREIIRLGASLGVDFSLTWSCYNPQEGGKPCRVCDSCLLRKKGFSEAGIKDPLD